MKYVVLIRSDPRPWGHPTGEFVAAQQALPAEERARAEAAFEGMFAELQESGELRGGEALGDPATAKVARFVDGRRVIADGPYSNRDEHLAGFFIIDVASPERAAAVVEAFSGPGETVELRPVHAG